MIIPTYLVLFFVLGLGLQMDIFRIQVAREGNIAGQTEISEMERLAATSWENPTQWSNKLIWIIERILK